MHLETCNQAAIEKHLWNLCNKKNRLWIQWVSTSTTSKEEIHGILTQDKHHGREHYSIKHMYHKLRGDFPKVEWWKLTCNNDGGPKWLFILQLAMLGKLYTKDQLAT
ncbi:hypothetical protein H5410_046940 [Solanum commersonii]|uniref:Uncharacterized protein n=1 Tax=Solanum commersonii TaxID=4109 RepID=A0A9J5XFT3_SOLCO|nr:hypothetical protein H5410_046940 [Solanum commersonii]